MELIFIISILIISSLINILFKKRIFIECVSVISVFTTLVLSTVVAIKVANFGFYNPFPFFYIDALGAIMILLVSFIGFFTVVYSIQYLRKETAKNII